jgi:hypothetical protein
MDVSFDVNWKITEQLCQRNLQFLMESVSLWLILERQPGTALNGHLLENVS